MKLMRRVFTILCAVLLSASVCDVAAQSVYKRVGAYYEDGSMVVADAQTTFVIDLRVECERVIVGPYARYAQKYLGKRASLVDRVTYDIIGADIALVDKRDYSPSEVEPRSLVVSNHLGDETSFGVLPISQLSGGEEQMDSAAAAAAEQLFALRRARLDLITGEYGDGVYGGGLESALREIEHMEQEILSLFYGKRSVETFTERIYLPLESEQTAMLVARFSDSEGVVAIDDLTGELIMLTIEPSEMEYPTGNEKGRIAYRYANNSRVVLTLGQDKLFNSILPIYEFGRTVMYATPLK